MQRARRAWTRWWPWALGAAAAVAVMGPALGPGSLLNLDLVLTPELPVPSGVWGLGPDLPRRVPYGVVLAWGSQLFSGPAVGKAWIVASVVAGAVGAGRLAGGAPAGARAGAALLYALGPFLLTRIAVGHLGLVAAIALLPWALPSLLRPLDRPRHTLAWAIALGCTGFAGGALALALAGVGVVAERSRRAVLVGAGVVVAQLPWAVPGLVVTLTGNGLDPADPSAFATDLDGPAGVLRLAAGHGFWRASSQIGGGGTAAAALLGAVLLVLALAGASRLPAPWRGRGAAAAAAGAALAAASALPGLDEVYGAFAGTPVGAPARESHRWLALFLVWMAPAAALGAARLGSRVLAVVPAAVALALAGPSLWGLDGRLQPLELPGGWSRAAAAIRARPGPVVALPWHQYLDLSIADGRRVLHPLPDYLGGDVLTASDPELGARRQERADPREPRVGRLLDRLEAGDDVSGGLAQSGFRWVAVLREVDFERYAALGEDDGLERVVTDDTIDLYRVRDWRGPGVTADGEAVDVQSAVAPIASIDGDVDVTWHRPGLAGWARGWAAAARTRDGTLVVPRGEGPVWYRPAVVVAIADVCTLVLVGALLMRRRVGTVGGAANEAQYGQRSQGAT